MMWPAHADPAKATGFYFRGGILHVAPQSESREVELTNVTGITSLAIQNGPIAGSGVTIGSATIPAFIIGYVLPVLDGQLSLETVLGLPFSVKLRATGTLATDSLAPYALGFIPTGVPPLGPELGEANVVPPLVTLVYRPQVGRIRPFVGGGIGMLFTYDEHITNPVLTAVSPPHAHDLAGDRAGAPSRRRGADLGEHLPAARRQVRRVHGRARDDRAHPGADDAAALVERQRRDGARRRHREPGDRHRRHRPRFLTPARATP